MPKTSKNTWSKDELRAIRASLPSGWQELLASQFGLAIGTIQNVIYGSKVNDSIVLAAVDLAKQHQAKIAEAKKSIPAI